MKKFVLLLMLIVMTLALGTILLYTDAFQLEVIDISSGWIPEAEILERAQLRLGQNLFFIDKFDVIGLLKEDFRIEEITFKKVYPSGLSLEIKPKTPYLKLNYENKILVLDDKKTLIDLEDSYPGLPLLRDFTIQEFELGQPLLVSDEIFLKNAFDLVELCKLASFENIILWEDSGLIYLFLDEGFKAAFGNGSDIEVKFNNFYTIYEDLLDKGINKGTINLTNARAPTFLPFD